MNTLNEHRPRLTCESCFYLKCVGSRVKTEQIRINV